jgi:hypothetical protein
MSLSPNANGPLGMKVLGIRMAGFSGSKTTSKGTFVTLKPWGERGPNDSSAAIVADSNKALAAIRDAKISALQPPPIDNLGNSSGFSFRLQDRAQKGYEARMAAKDQLLAAAKESPILQDAYVEGLPPAPLAELIIDREKAAALGVTFQEINNTISTNLGSNYANDFRTGAGCSALLSKRIIRAACNPMTFSVSTLRIIWANWFRLVLRLHQMESRADADGRFQLLSLGKS